jgi:hypothetical protein
MESIKAVNVAIEGSLSKLLSGHGIDNEGIQSLAQQILGLSEKPSRINPCMVGICVDFHTEKPPSISDFYKDVTGARVVRIDVSIYGIVRPDLHRIRVMLDTHDLKK